MAISHAQVAATPSRDALRRYLVDVVGFSGRDWRDILNNTAVARNLDTRENIEVSIYGVIRIEGRPRDFVDRIREIDELERKLKIIGVGKFSDPPRLQDLDGVELSEQDAGDVRNCRPGDCQLQLTARAMQRFDTLVDWERDDARTQAARVYREMMFDLLQAYREGGARALPAFVDQTPPTIVADEMALLVNPLDAPVPIPELRRYLRDYPRAVLPGSESLFYWNTGEFGMKPTTRVNQIVIQPIPTPVASMPGLRHIIATQQVYANHYFSATLELRSIIEDDGGDAFFLLYATRSRIPGLSGFFKAILRTIVRSRARSGMERYLTRTKALIEGTLVDTP